MKTYNIAPALMVCALLTACGGGTGEENVIPPLNSTPPNADTGDDTGSGSGGDAGGGTGGDTGGGTGGSGQAEVIGDAGFGGYDFDLTGGEGGLVYTVNNGVDLLAKLAEAKQSGSPITLYIDGEINEFNSGVGKIDIASQDNVSLIGVGTKGEFDGIGLYIRRANNIIVQNLTFHHPRQGDGPGDAISIEGDDDGSTTHHIWIDHCELYSSLLVDKDYYDGLFDSKGGADSITMSYSYLHDHSKTSLHGSTDNDPNPNTERMVTFHHNRFENLVSRVPLYRHGKGHIYNNYFNNITSTTINSRMGAEILIENNVFENARNPIVSFYSATVGYWNLSGNVFGDGVTWSTPGTGEASAENGQSTTDYTVPYDYSLDATDGLKAYIIANAGVGVIDQSALQIPDPVTAIADVPTPETSAQGGTALPYRENFAASDASVFLSNSYRDISGSAGSDTPMYHRVTGTVEVNSEQLSLTGARVSIGNTTPSVSTTPDDLTTTGVLDLSKPYQITFTVVSVSGETAKNFMLYVDNNTASSGNSIHGGSSKFYTGTLSDFTPGQSVTVGGLDASETSFLTLRTESGANIVIDDLVIEYIQ